MASAEAVLAELDELGTEQNRKTYARHGVGEPMSGVSYANLEKLRKKIGTDHDLAVDLWVSGNHDARVLATMIADPNRIVRAVLDAWVAALDSYVITDAFTKLALRAPSAVAAMRDWIEADGEWVEATGWGMLAGMAMADGAFEDDAWRGYLERIEREIHAAKNRVGYSMNSALIAIGTRSDELESAALAAAERIGAVEVDHGLTGCKTPAAGSYIPMARDRRRARQARLASARR